MRRRLISSMASRTSSGERMTFLGRPDMRSRPRTSALNSSSVGHAEPMAILISSAVRSPMAMPYSRRIQVWMAASMSKQPTRTALRATTPPREITAVSEVPPPMSTTMLPRGSLIGQPGADGGGHGLLDELRLGGARPAGRLA